MDERSARQLVRNTFDLLAAGDRAAISADPAFIAAFQRVARLLETLPPVGDITRERAWREMKPAVLQALEPAAGQLGLSIVNELADELKAQVTFATNVLQTQGQIVDKNGVTHTTSNIGVGGFSVDEPGASAIRRAAGDFSQNVRSVEAPWATTGTIAQIGAAAVPDSAADTFTIRVPPSVAKQISRTRISGQTLERAFPISIEGSGAAMTLGRGDSGFAQFMVNTLDTRVRTALLRGDTTEEVARELIFDSMKQGLNLGPTANQLKNHARAAARTALMDGSQRIQEEVWDANPGVIAGWEFDATNDSRTCPRCFPLDGLFSKEKEGIPSTPLHPGCRCRRLPLTNTAMLLRAEGDEPGGSSVELVAPGDVPQQRDGESTKDYKARLSAERYFLTKGKAGGEMWVRRAIDHKAIKQTMAVDDLPPAVRAILREEGKLKPGQTKLSMERGMTGPQWLAQSTTSEASKQVAFGGGQAGAVRAKLFDRWVNTEKMSPERAFDKLLVGNKGNTSFIPLKELQKMGIQLPQATPIRSESYLKQQAKRAAAAQREAQAMAAKLQPPSRPVKAGFSTTIGSPRQLIKEGTAVARPILSKRTNALATEAGQKIRRMDEVSTLLNRRANGLKLPDAPPNDKLVLEARQLRAEVAALEEKGAKGMNALRQVLLRSDINLPEANVLARGLTYRNGAGAWVGDVREYALMFNGRGLYRTGEAFTSTVSKTVRRGHYSQSTSTSVASSRRVLWHELTHGLEKQDPQLLEAAAEWRGIRATGPNTKTLRAITGVSNYRSSERALEDDWVNPYVGKVYRDGKGKDWATEVLTMGAEHFSTPGGMFRLYARDPDLFHLIVSLTRKAYR